MAEIYVTKASGERTPFSEKKLRSSLQKAGAQQSDIDSIVERVRKKLDDGISTRKVYKTAFSMLRAGADATAAKYKLKDAIMELGPSGYPFEKFIGEILKHQGYTVEVGSAVQGLCVTHEVDVVATSDHEGHIIECKFHNRPGTRSDVKVPLYINSRYNDIKKAWKETGKYKFHSIDGWVVTNTRFTKDAIQYGHCVGLRLIGWDYPKENSLKAQIEKAGLYPITSLTSIDKSAKQFLLDHGFVLCKDILHNERLLMQAGLTEHQARRATEEMKKLCNMCD